MRFVFRDLTLKISAGECVGILGREGCGKTTLLQLLGGLLTPGKGKMLIDGVDPHARAGGREEFRLRMGFTFQFPEEQFLCPTVKEEFADIMRLRAISPAEFPARTNSALANMGLDPGAIAERSPFSLSLGESRRLALALLLAIAPEAVLLDEPTAGLDAQGFSCALNAIGSLRRTGATVIIATHDVNLLAETAGRVLMLGEGGVESDGDAEHILADGGLLDRFGYSLPEVVSTASELRAQGRIDGRPVLRLNDLIERAGESRKRRTRE